MDCDKTFVFFCDKNNKKKQLTIFVNDVPNINKENFVKIMEKYNGNFSKTRICEKIIPRKYDESTLNQFCNQFNYTKKGENDFEALTKLIFLKNKYK